MRCRIAWHRGLWSRQLLIGHHVGIQAWEGARARVTDMKFDQGSLHHDDEDKNGSNDNSREYEDLRDDEDAFMTESNNYD